MTRAPASASRQLHIGAATACSSDTTNNPESGNVMRGPSVNADRPRDRDIGQNLVLLDPRLGPVLFVDILERGFSQQLARQDHHANEPRGPVGCRLRENRIGTAFIPRSTRPIGSGGAL